jgi:GNAT superfamily N-acetyltransferase
MLSASLSDVATSEGNVRRIKWTREVEDLLGRSFSGSKTSEPEWGVHWTMGPEWASDLDNPARVALSIFLHGLALAAKVPESTMLGVHGTGDKLAAFALVQELKRAPAATPAMEALRIMRSFAARALCCRLPPGWKDKALFKRGDAVTAIMGALHAKHANRPHLYLSMIAADPMRQGQGHGGRLIRAVLRVADAAGLPIYLECGGERLKGLYAHFGFELVGDAPLEMKGDVDGWPTHPIVYYAMIRPPQSTAAAAK